MNVVGAYVERVEIPAAPRTNVSDRLINHVAFMPVERHRRGFHRFARCVFTPGVRWEHRSGSSARVTVYAPTFVSVEAGAVG